MQLCRVESKTTDRRPIGIRQFGSKGSGAKSKSGRVFRARTTEARGERETACVRVPVNNTFAVTRYKYKGSIGY